MYSYRWLEGIGEATVRRFISEGAEVLIADINLEDSKKLSEEIGEGVDYIKCDVRLEDDIISVSEKAYGMWDQVDVLVNNAGSELNQSYDKMTEAEWDNVLNTDLKGPWLMCKHIVPDGRGRIRKCYQYFLFKWFSWLSLSTAYGSAKGGLVVFTRDMAIELASTGVRINCVCPGVIQTGMMERWTDLMPDKAEAQEMLRNTMPIGRMGTAEEVAGAIFFFASDDSSLCQGSVLEQADGGRLHSKSNSRRKYSTEKLFMPIFYF